MQNPPLYLLRGEGGYGIVLCDKHANELYPHDPARLPLPKADVVGLTCILCATYPVVGRSCEFCAKPLHPNWPAVYCSNACALADV